MAKTTVPIELSSTPSIVDNGNATAITIDSSENVGIGVSPTEKLTVNGALAITGALVDDRTSTGAIDFSGGITRFVSYGASGVGGIFAFRTASGGASSAERMRIDSSGNVGIGTSSPLNDTNKTTLDLAGTWGGQVNISVSGTEHAQFGSDNYGSGLSCRIESADGIVFRGGSSAERMRIDASGNLLVGTTSFGSSAVGFGVNGNNSSSSKGACISVINSSSNGNTTYEAYSLSASAYRFYVGMAGTVFATSTTISSISDIRYKENIRDLDAGLAEVMALKPRLYDWKEGKGADIKNDRGFIAQEFEEVFPDLIDEWRDPAPEGEDPYKSVRQDLIPVLVKAIQEQQAIIEDLKARITALEGN
jgi:hypothetical protein